jgi:hypothetical protein
MWQIVTEDSPLDAFDPEMDFEDMDEPEYDDDTDAPDVNEVIEMMADDDGCEATDGCWVEPDGHCEHGNPSWALAYGLI